MADPVLSDSDSADAPSSRVQRENVPDGASDYRIAGSFGRY